MRRRFATAVLLTFACGVASVGTNDTGDGDGDASPSPDVTDSATIVADAAPLDEAPADAGADADAGVGCVAVADTPVPIATATAAGEQVLTLIAKSASQTSWQSKGNEAIVLEALVGAKLLGHLVLHQGQAPFPYGMHAGALAAGDVLSVRVSPLSATGAEKRATVCDARLGPADEGALNAPVLVWPIDKRFDDLPVVLGWSKTKKHYELVYTNENGGTVVQCGGGASGMQAELARWGRGADIEGIYTYGASPSWERCTGTQPNAPNAPRMEAAHPILYYGDGHNRLFESRGGYGQTCGSGAAEKPDGDHVGWNVQNPGNDPANDAKFAVIVRPVPVDLDAIGYAQASGRREAMLDTYAPWLYRITDEELKREGKVDGTKCLTMERYVFVDVQAADVQGSGDRVCSLTVNGGFVLRLHTRAGKTLDGPQMTADYFIGNPGWKRLAIPLDQTYASADFTGMTFDAYDNDGIFFMAIGDAFMPRPSGDNGATLEYVRKGTKNVGVYVDDGNDGCVGGVNATGPGDAGYPCVGGLYDFVP